MAYFITQDGILYNDKDFDIKQTLECGQCFRFYPLPQGQYLVIAKDKLLVVKQEQSGVLFYCNEKEFLELWQDYFDLTRDYCQIKKTLCEKDIYLKDATQEKFGLRLLHQEPWEMLISFILSQNKQIPHIKKLIEAISKSYGDLIGTFEDVNYYSFPTPNQLKDASDEAFRNLKVGFRAPYLIDATQHVVSGRLVLDDLYKLSYDEAKTKLMMIKGVGEKVADCVLLYGFGKYEAFPTDVWIKRVMLYYYASHISKENEIRNFAKDYFGNLAGFAQQYLFYHARDHKIGK